MTVGLLNCSVLFMNHKLATLILADFPSEMDRVFLTIEMFDGFQATALFRIPDTIGIWNHVISFSECHNLFLCLIYKSSCNCSA